MKYLIPITLLLVVILLSACNRKTAQKMTTKTGSEVPVPPPSPSPPPESGVAIDGQDHGLVMISIDRKPCNGTCPWYSAKIYEDGAIFYNGRKQVKLKGEQTALTTTEKINTLIRKAEGIGFFDMENEYPANRAHRIMDLPITVLKVRSGNKVKQIRLQNHMPEALKNFASELDEFFFAQRFQPLFGSEKVPEQVPTADGNDHGTLQLTLEKMPCYGNCPWFTASFYDDGTILYNGKKDVKHLGAYRLKTTPAMVRALTKDAKKAGFFQMEVRYPTNQKNAISDLPKVLLMVKNGRSSHTITYQNEAPQALIKLVSEIDATLARQTFVGHKK